MAQSRVSSLLENLRLSEAPLAQTQAVQNPEPPGPSANLSPRPSSAESRSSADCPNEFLCPITKGLMEDPVLLVETGHSFERWAIDRWFLDGNATCPLTGVQLTNTQVSPNLTLRKLIQDWKGRHPTHSAARQASQWTPNLYPQPGAAPQRPHGVNGPVPPLFAPFAIRGSRFETQAFRATPPQSQQPELPPANDDEPLDESTPVPSLGVRIQPVLKLIPEYTTIGTQSEELLILAKVAAPETETRVPIDLVAVLDVSGSMAGARISLVKETMAFVISQLQPSDRLSIVAFDSRARRALKLTRGTARGKEQMTAAVQALVAGGGTSISAGLRMGLHVLTSRRASNPVACFIFLSDGRDSYVPDGVDRAVLTSAAQLGASVHAFGYGRDHDEKVLDFIAAETNGTFTFIRENGEVKEAVAQCLGGALSVALQATTIHITAAPGVAVKAVESGVYEATMGEAQESASVALRDMYSGETRDVLITVQTPATSAPGFSTDLLYGELEYTLPGGDGVSRSPPVTVSVARAETGERSDPNMEVDSQRNRLITAQAMTTADRLAGEGDLREARVAISSATDRLRQSVSSQAPATVALRQDLEEIERVFASAEEYQSEGAKSVKSAARMHSSQRSAYQSSASVPRPATRDPYASSAALSMRRTASENS